VEIKTCSFPLEAFFFLHVVFSDAVCGSVASLSPFSFIFGSVDVNLACGVLRVFAGSVPPFLCPPSPPSAHYLHLFCSRSIGGVESFSSEPGLSPAMRPPYEILIFSPETSSHSPACLYGVALLPLDTFFSLSALGVPSALSPAFQSPPFLFFLSGSFY